MKFMNAEPDSFASQVAVAGQAARAASRVMALAVAGVSLLTAAMVLATLLVPAADAWAQGKELWFGTGIVAVLLASYLTGQRLASRAPVVHDPSGSTNGPF